LTTHNRRRFVHQLVVAERLHHKTSEIHTTGDVAFENGDAHMAAPHRQAVALTLFEIAASHDSSTAVAGKDATARFHLIVQLRKRVSRPTKPKMFTIAFSFSE
jgi:hypothetical protein